MEFEVRLRDDAVPQVIEADKFVSGDPWLVFRVKEGESWRDVAAFARSEVVSVQEKKDQ